MKINDIKKLREITSLGIGDCKSALEDAKGDFNKALQILKDKGIQLIMKKKDRKTSQGLIEAYVHFSGNLGALVEVNCESDFVARTDVFRNFVKDMAIQIAATNPKYLARDDISQSELKEDENVDEYVKENCLLEQVFIKDNKVTVGEYLRTVASQTGENIVIRKFIRFYLGE